MDLLYREVSFRYSTAFYQRKFFNRLQDPFVAMRTRVLHFAPDFLLRQPKYRHKFVDQVKKLILRQKPNPTTSPFVLTKHTTEKMLHIFNTMSSLTSFHLYISDKHYEKSSFPLTVAACTAFGSNLLELTFDLIVEAMCRILSSSLVFPKLEALHITLTAYYDTPDDTEVVALMAAFINQHRLTLQSLTIATRFIDHTKLDFEELFLGLGHFPHLKKIAINIPSSGAKTFARNVLRPHATELRELSISRYRPGGAYDDIALPNLSSLSLRMEKRSSDIPGIIPYLHPLGNSLTSLVLHRHRLSFDDVCNIFELFTQQDKLRLLSMELDCFLSPQFFDGCSEKLPSLNDLTLFTPGYKDLDHDGNSIEADEEMFCQQMLLRNYANWSLRRFHVVTLCRQRSNPDMCNTTLKIIFPYMTSLSLLPCWYSSASFLTA